MIFLNTFIIGVASLMEEWVSDCSLIPTQQFSAISWREKVNLKWDDDEVHFILDQHALLHFLVLAHWKNSLQIDMSPHSDTLSWFRVNQSLLFLLNAACMAKKATNTNIIVFGLTSSELEPIIYCTHTVEKKNSG
jgi:hypothetical protein